MSNANTSWILGIGILEEIKQIQDPRVKPVHMGVEDHEGLVTLFQGAEVVIELLPIRFTMNVAKAILARSRRTCRPRYAYVTYQATEYNRVSAGP